jgi:hypothetical protein
LLRRLVTLMPGSVYPSTLTFELIQLAELQIRAEDRDGAMQTIEAALVLVEPLVQSKHADKQARSSAVWLYLLKADLLAQRGGASRAGAERWLASASARRSGLGTTGYDGHLDKIEARVRKRLP